MQPEATSKEKRARRFLTQSLVEIAKGNAKRAAGHARRWPDRVFRPLFGSEEEFSKFAESRSAFEESALADELDLPAFARFLVESGADASFRSSDATFKSKTPLMIAAVSGEAEAVKALAELADVEARDEQGRTALALAALLHELECVEALLPLGEARTTDSRGQTPLMHAASTDWRGSKETIRLLLPASDVDAKDMEGSTALMIAAKNGAEEALKSLLGASDANAVDNESMSALMRASQCGRLDCVKMLLPLSDVSQKDQRGKTALDLAGEKTPFQKWPIADLFVGLVSAQELSEFARGNERCASPKIAAALEREELARAFDASPGLPRSPAGRASDASVDESKEPSGAGAEGGKAAGLGRRTLRV